MKGKEKCKALKEIRRQIAEENDIPYVVSQCTYQGECKGTCPKCEAELRYLEKELARKEKLGQTVAVVGISVGLCSSLTACAPIDAISSGIREITSGFQTLEGDTLYIGDDVVGLMEEPLYPEAEPSEDETNSKEALLIPDTLEGEVVIETLEGDIQILPEENAFDEN